MAIVIIARWFPRADSRDEFIRVVGRLKDSLTQQMLANFSVLLPTISRDGAVVFIEKWDSEEIMNTLRSSPGFHAAIRDMSACCDRPLEIEHLGTVDSSGEFSSLRPIESARYPAGKADPRYYPDLGPMTPRFV
ncbi:MAG TPA: antibiotic biosynthesis monooxygenase [Steroidobacteraceae bacterium]|nr:antibiotic biosynthesis monooxygenase [Steroidobacteraceae bacterium]